jgi:tetratricopeptide (TPR) repeat protein
LVETFVLLLSLSCALWAAGPEYDQARKLYNLTEFDQSLKILQANPAKRRRGLRFDRPQLLHAGRFQEGYRSSGKAVAAEPGNSEFNLWLGRAYGRRAETSSLFTAPGHASKARQYFEKAAQLNPRNLEAQSDLFEYYLEAPGFLGGGFEKAAATAEQIARINPAEGHWAQARLDEQRKEFSSAEEQLRRAIELTPHQVGRLIDLARLLAKQGRMEEAEQSFARAEAIAPDSPKVLFAKADVYIKAGKNLNVAKDLLKRYLSLALTPEDPPRSQAEKLLKQLQGG